MKIKLLLNEASLPELYATTVKAFPKTTKRQYSTDTIKINQIFWSPYLNFETLFVKGLAQNTENGHEYNPIILFKEVTYSNKKNKKTIVLRANDGLEYFVEPINLENEVSVRCNCKDFSWRFNYFNHVDKSLYGRVRKKYEAKFWPDSANPSKLPGLCKHLIKLAKAIDNSGIIQS